MTDLNEQFKKDIAENDVILYMKGDKRIPMCGFSAAVVGIFNKLNIPFYDVNVLNDRAVWDGIKKFSDWPTIPQIYIKGEFIGGCDIVKEMYETGELQELLKEKGVIAA